jgi:hypothetical protein
VGRLVDDTVLDGEAEAGYDTLLHRQLLAGAMEQLSRPHRDVRVQVTVSGRCQDRPRPR